MFNKLGLVVISIALVATPFLGSVQADDNRQTLISSAAWNYDVFSVERLVVDSDFEGPYSFGNEVFFSEPAQSCGIGECNWVNISFLKNDSMLEVNNVRADILDSTWHAANEGRFVYLSETDLEEGDWMNVNEYDSLTGTTSLYNTIPESETDYSVTSFVVDGDRYYLSTIGYDEDGVIKSNLWLRDVETDFEREFTHANWRMKWKEVLDVQDNIALVKVHFEGGFKQLFITDPTARTIIEVPGTWTEPFADIVAAHFRSDGTIAYFRNFIHNTWDPSSDVDPVAHGGAFLNWFQSLDESVQVVGDRMAWVDSANQLYFSDTDGVSRLGAADLGQFTLTKDYIFFSKNGEGVQYKFEGAQFIDRNFLVTDVYDDAAVGVDLNGNIWYLNLNSGKTFEIGYGLNPYLTDLNHAVWRGVDGNVYQATFSELLDMDITQPRAVRAPGSKTVYLIQGGDRWTVPNEQVYFTWFSSWDDVNVVSSVTLNSLNDKGTAKFLPGTRVKIEGNKRVYTVGVDGKLHWIVTEVVAYNVYGSRWNKNIIELRPEQLWNYSLGRNVETSNDITTI